MSDITPIGRTQAAGLNHSTRRDAAQTTGDGPDRGHDSVELSIVSQLRARISELPETRDELIDSVRAQFTYVNGQRTAASEEAYLTDERIDQAIENLLGEAEQGLV